MREFRANESKVDRLSTGLVRLVWLQGIVVPVATANITAPHPVPKTLTFIYHSHLQSEHRDPWVNFIKGYFCVGATFEMIGLNTKKCIFQLIKITAAQRLLSGEK